MTMSRMPRKRGTESPLLWRGVAVAAGAETVDAVGAASLFWPALDLQGLVGDDDQGDDVGQDRRAAHEEQGHGDQADDDRVDLEVFGDAAADPAEHAVLPASIQSFH